MSVRRLSARAGMSTMFGGLASMVPLGTLPASPALAQADPPEVVALTVQASWLESDPTLSGPFGLDPRAVPGPDSRSSIAGWDGRWPPGSYEAMMRAAALHPGDADAIVCPEAAVAFHRCRLESGDAVMAVSRADIQGEEARVRVRVHHESSNASSGSAGVVVQVHDVVLVLEEGRWRFQRRELRLSS